MSAWRGWHDDGKPEVGGQPFRDRSPRAAVVVAAQHADVRPRAPGSRPVGPSSVVLHVEPSRCGFVAHDLVDALPELGVGVGREARADALVGGLEGLAAVLAQVVTAGRDAQVHAVPVAHDRVETEPARARLPLARVLVIADAGHHLPRIAPVAASEQGGWFDAAPQVLLAVAGPRGTRCSRGRGRRPWGTRAPTSSP